MKSQNRIIPYGEIGQIPKSQCAGKLVVQCALLCVSLVIHQPILPCKHRGGKGQRSGVVLYALPAWCLSTLSHGLVSLHELPIA